MTCHTEVCSRDLVVGVETLGFSERAQVGGQVSMFPFTETVHWLRDATADVVLQHEGVHIKKLASYVDVRDYLECPYSALELAYSSMASYQIGRQSTLEVAVLINVEDRPHVLHRASDASSAYMSRYQPVPSGWFVREDGAPAESSFKPLCSQTVVDSVKVYSSLEHFTNPDAAKAKMSAYVEAWRGDVRAILTRNTPDR